MLQNYFKIAIRQIFKHKLFSALNIFGLATSMAVCLLVIMILMDAHSYDTFHENGDHIYRAISAKREKGQELKMPEMATTSMALAKDLKSNYPFIEKATRISGCDGVFKIGEKEFGTTEGGYLVDADFLSMFSFGWIAGEERSALAKPRSIVLTDEQAEIFFPYSNPLGQTVEFEDLGKFTVTGILPKVQFRSHIKFDFLFSMSSVETFPEKDQKELGFQQFDNIWKGLVYVQLKEDAGKNDFQKALTAMATQYSNHDEKSQYLFQAQSIYDVMPSDELGNEIGLATPKIVLNFVTILGIIIILAAAFNYMNLSVARSIKRSKEIGIRKVAGARRKDIIYQFLGESILISLFSLVVAMVMLEFLIPAFYALDPFVETAFYLTKSPELYAVFFVFAILVGFLAGIFPAFNISKFQPIQSIQKLSNVKVFSKIGLRKALVTTQFALSLIFILTVLLVLKQQNHVLNADLGVRTDNLMGVWMQDAVDYDIFAQQVAQIKGVESVTSSKDAILLGSSAHESAKFNQQRDSINLSCNWVRSNYIEAMEIKLIAGENFPTNKNSKGEQFIILNKKAMERMGFKTPESAIGETLSFDTLGLTVIGVTADFHHKNIWWDAIEPFGFRQGEKAKNCAQIRIAEANSKETIAAIHDVWKTLSPDESINSFFTDTRAYHMAKFFKMGSKILGFVGFLTILISCLGLLGMVVYTIEGKLKEVGIRKVLGASERNINWQLAKGFLLLLGIAIAIAIPVVLFVGNWWLDNFVLRTSINSGMILLGVSIIFLLALVTVLSQTTVAARTNPVNVLKNE